MDFPDLSGLRKRCGCRDRPRPGCGKPFGDETKHPFVDDDAIMRELFSTVLLVEPERWVSPRRKAAR